MKTAVADDVRDAFKYRAEDSEALKDARRFAVWPDVWNSDALSASQRLPVVAVLAGRFRPPHAGHVALALRLLQCCDAVVVAIDASDDGAAGRGERTDAFTPLFAAECWEEQLRWAGLLPLQPQRYSDPRNELLRSGLVLRIGSPLAIETALFALAETGACVAVRVAGQESLLVEPPDCAVSRRLPLIVLPREAGGICSTELRARPLIDQWQSSRSASVARIAAGLFPGGPTKARRDLAALIANALYPRPH